jgi:uncharacterized membrane protein (UPF0182 family)
MSLTWLLSSLLLAAAFGVLVWTFVWIARLLTERAAAAERQQANADTEPAAPGEEPEASADEAAQEEEKRRTGTGVNATLGLILAALACVLFWVSPLTIVLTLAGLWFSGNALWAGFSWFGVFIPRAALGILLSLASAGLHFGYLTGLFTLPI